MPIKKQMSIKQWIQNEIIKEEEGQSKLFKISQGHLQETSQRSEEEPVPAPGWLNEYLPCLWFFKGDVYDVEDIRKRYKYNDEQIQLLILEHYDKERRKFERLRQRYKSEVVQRESRRRERIPEQVRIAVWRRDGGKCVRCGSRENLEYDHIIPVSKGGSNTARNIELLCERCNREKRDRIE